MVGRLNILFKKIRGLIESMRFLDVILLVVLVAILTAFCTINFSTIEDTSRIFLSSFFESFSVWDRQNRIPFLFGLYLIISLVFFSAVVRLFSYREVYGENFVKDKANKILDFFIGFLLLCQIFFLNHVQYLFGPNTFIVKPFTARELQIIGSLDLHSTTLQVIVGFSFIIFLVVLRLNQIKFDPFVILLFILLNPFLIFLCFSQNMVYFFIFFEGFALVTTLLIVISGQYNGVRVPRYDVLVYLIYSLVGTSLMTLGLTIIFVWSMGSVSFFDGNFIFKLMLLSSTSSYQKSAALVFFLVSLNMFFKLGVFPFQNWIMPVYNSLNTSVLFYVVLFSKFVVSLVFIFKFYPAFFSSYILWIFFLVGILSMIIGVYFGLGTVKIREIVGASSIVNYGVVMLLISYSAPLCAIFYMLCYTITLFNMLVCVLPYKNKESDEIIETTDRVAYRPRMSSRGLYFDFYVIFSIGALIGLPPFLFFYAKIFVLNVFINWGTIGSYIMAVLFLLVNVLSAVYYLRLLFVFIRGSTTAFRAELVACYYSGATFTQICLKFLFFLFLVFGICWFDSLCYMRDWVAFLNKFIFDPF